MVTTIGLIIWSVFVLGIIGVGFWQMISHIKRCIDRDYKYCINIHKEGFEKLKAPLIKMKIKGKYKYFLVDSGAAKNLISKKAFQSISKEGDEVKIVDNVHILGVSGKEDKAVPVIEETISVGRDKFVQNFMVSEEWETTREYIHDTCGIEIIGLLGSEFFQKARWLIDFDNLVIWVKK